MKNLLMGTLILTSLSSFAMSEKVEVETIKNPKVTVTNTRSGKTTKYKIECSSDLNAVCYKINPEFTYGSDVKCGTEEYGDIKRAGELVVGFGVEMVDYAARVIEDTFSSVNIHRQTQQNMAPSKLITFKHINSDGSINNYKKRVYSSLDYEIENQGPAEFIKSIKCSK